METLSALLTLCEGNSPAIGGLHSLRVDSAVFDVFFDVSLGKRLNTVGLPVICDAMTLIVVSL